MKRIFGLCGSLRSKSYNLALLNTFFMELSSDADCRLFDRLEEIPPFHPEHSPNEAVLALRSEIAAADLILIASPEYVHGIPGVLKNALDWVVGTGEWDGKPTAIFNVTPSTNEPQFARDQLKEIIKVMSAGKVIDEACFVVTGAFKKISSDGQITDPETQDQIRNSVRILSSKN